MLTSIHHQFDQCGKRDNKEREIEGGSDVEADTPCPLSGRYWKMGSDGHHTSQPLH